jgi:hypothetical protein
MKARLLIVSCLLVVLALCLSFAATAQEQEQEPKPKSEKFGALAYMPHGAGLAMVGAGARVNVDLYVRSYTTDAEAKSPVRCLKVDLKHCSRRWRRGSRQAR